MLEQVQGKALEPRLRSSKKMLKGNPGANLVAGLASIAEVSLEGEEDLERSRVMFFTRPMFMKMSRSKEIESEMRFRWSEVAVKSWENVIMNHDDHCPAKKSKICSNEAATKKPFRLTQRHLYFIGLPFL